MRKAINENQVVLIGILVVVAGFLFMTRIAGGGEESSTPAATTPAAPTPTTTTPAAKADSAPPAAETQAGSQPEPSTEAPAGGDAFVAGPGLPEPVAAAYDRGETVVLLVVRQRGIDDRKVEADVRSRAGLGDTALFVTRAKGIAKYSRIAQGVQVDRVPAMVVIQPKRLTEGPLPEASVSYGYRGPQSIEQAVRDALYEGRENIPYYPQ